MTGRRKSGVEFPVEAMLSRQKVDGITILTVVSRDITERKEVEELREAIAREQDHRLKNVLAVVNSLISLTASNASNVEEFRDALIGRLNALAATQSALRFGQLTSTSLNKLFLAELAQYQTEGGGKVVVEGPDVSVGGAAAQLLALAVHELATNSAKYGALRNASGRVILTFTTTGDANELLIQWQETGGPPVRPPERRGFGTDLIHQLIGKALRAHVSFDYRPMGLVCRMTLPSGIVDMSPS